MKFLLTTLILCSVACLAQDARVEIGLGYSYLNADTNGLTSRQSLNGWEVSVAGNFNKWLAAEFTTAGYYKTISGIGVSDYSYLAGPRIKFKPLFMHALVGGDHLRGSAAGSSASQDGLGAAFGGGVQWRLAPHLATFSAVDYVLGRHNILLGPSKTQNNVRVSVGLVFSFGGRAASNETASTSPAAPGMEISSLGVTVSAVQGGAKIVGIEAGGVAERNGLHVGDVVIGIDGKTIASPAELATELANRRGNVRLRYMVRGYWQTERMISLTGT